MLTDIIVRLVIRRLIVVAGDRVDVIMLTEGVGLEQEHEDPPPLRSIELLIEYDVTDSIAMLNSAVLLPFYMNIDADKKKTKT